MQWRAIAHPGRAIISSSTFSVRAMIVATIRKSITPGEDLGHAGQPITYVRAIVHLAHRPGVADVLHRRDLGGHQIGDIGGPPLDLGAPGLAAGIQLADGGQPLRDRRRLIARGLTHHIDEIRIRHALEHTFDYATAHRHQISLTARRHRLQGDRRNPAT